MSLRQSRWIQDDFAGELKHARNGKVMPLSDMGVAPTGDCLRSWSALPGPGSGRVHDAIIVRAGSRCKWKLWTPVADSAGSAEELVVDLRALGCVLR